MKKSVTILHEDADLIVIDKPAGMLSIPDRFDGKAPNCLHFLRERFDNVLAVHRLDRDTSGVMVFARHQNSHRALCIEFEGRSVEKTYLALISGTPKTAEGMIDLPIAENPAKPGLVMISHKNGKPSQTQYRILEYFRGYCLAEVKPRTGRTHQIRIHFHAIGHPLAIDPDYHPAITALFLSQLKRGFKPKAGEPEKPLMKRLTLHASALEFTFNDKRRLFSTSIPKDFNALLKQLRIWAL